VEIVLLVHSKLSCQLTGCTRFARLLLKVTSTDRKIGVARFLCCGFVPAGLGQLSTSHAKCWRWSETVAFCFGVLWRDRKSAELFVDHTHCDAPAIVFGQQLTGNKMVFGEQL